MSLGSTWFNLLNSQNNIKAGKGNNNKKSNSITEHMIYKYSNNNVGPLYESILINNVGYFIVIEHSEIKLYEKIEKGEKIVLIPPQDKLSYLSKEYSFSSIEEIKDYVRRAKNENNSTLFRRVKKIWRKYFDNDNDALNICAADTLFTYFQDRLGMTHYLLFVGDNSTGKSNALRIFYRLGYRPIFDTDITPANIYNFLGRIEEGQGIILEDEIDNIEDQPEKMKIYKGGYVFGTKVTRLYESSSAAKSSKKQQSFFTFSFKAFSSESNPSFFKAKGFNERLLVIKCSSGNPQYDISEIDSNAGDPKFTKLEREIEDTRKLLFIYRILNYNKPIPDIHISIKNRDKQLCKPLLRLFQNTDVIDKVKKSLSKFIIEKKNKKLNSLDAFLYSIINDLSFRSSEDESSRYMFISNETMWSVIQTLPGSQISNKPYSYQTDEFGNVSKFQITRICEDKFGAKQGHDGKQRGLTFDKKILERLKVNFDRIENIEIISQNNPKGNILYPSINTSNTFNTFWNRIERNDFVRSVFIDKNMYNITNQVDIIDDNKQNKTEYRYEIYPDFSHENSKQSNKVLKVLEVLDYQKEIENKIKERSLYRKWSGSDTWACPICNDSGDKFHMINHLCRKNKKI